MFNGALPTGGVALAQLPLVLARGLWLAALLSATGALLFRVLLAPGEVAATPAVRVKLARLTLGSLVLAGLAWVVWVGLQAAAIAGATDLPAAVAALGTVFSRTAFGHRAAAQILFLFLASGALRLGRGWVSALLALAATSVQAGQSHAWAMQGGPSLLTGAVLLHLLVAAAWLGGLLPLAIVVRAAPIAAATAVVRRFSRLATVLVPLLAATALVQGDALLGGVAGLFGTTYGWLALAKTGLFAVLLAIAWRNRTRLAPALAGAQAHAARRALARSIATEAGVGVAVVVVAALLSTLPPGMHTQPAWPFSFRPLLPLPPTGWLVIAALGAAALLLWRAAVRRRFRLAALALAAILAVGVSARLGELIVPATPTSFYRSPSGYTAAAIADGAALFARACAGCHGAAALDPRRLAGLGDGELFWALSAGARAMPGFAATLDEDARWHLVDFLRARAAAGTLPVRAPDVDVTCADGNTLALSDFRGNLLRLGFGDATAPATPPGVAAIGLRVLAAPLPGTCAVTDPDARAAYALATGLAPATLAQTDLLIDAAGWLREIVRPDTGPEALAAALRRLAASPVPAPNPI